MELFKDRNIMHPCPEIFSTTLFISLIVEYLWNGFGDKINYTLRQVYT